MGAQETTFPREEDGPRWVERGQRFTSRAHGGVIRYVEGYQEKTLQSVLWFSDDFLQKVASLMETIPVEP